MTVPAFKMEWPVRPNRGVRAVDAWGAGGFGAPRRRNSETYGHRGLDFIAAVGDEILWPIAGQIIRIGRAYPDEAPGVEDPSDLHSIHFRGEGVLRLLRVKILYVAPRPGLVAFMRCGQGDLLGFAEDRAALARARNPAKGPMDNHIHVEMVWEEGEAELLNPAHFLVATP